jgi:hypothetical protein
VKTLEEYKEWFKEEFGHLPGMVCVESFLKMHPQEDNGVIAPVPESFWRQDPLDG